MNDMKKSYLLLADGFEEIEALATVDVMRRGGMTVETVSITDNNAVTGANGVTVTADVLMKDTDFAGAEFIVIPGGMPGSSNLAANKRVGRILTAQAATGKIAAICAAPAVVLGPLGLIDGREVTGYPGTEGGCKAAKWQGTQIVANDDLITGQAPGAAIKFALAIVANSCGKDVAMQVAQGMYVKNAFEY